MDAEYQNPYWALSIEEAVAIRVGQGLTPNTLRFWKTKNAVIIGRFQCPKSEASFNSCLRYGTAIVRRFTGGGAVYHDSGNLNFAVSIHLNPSLNIKPYNLLSKVGLAVISALKGFGISPAFDKMNIYVKNRKLSGMAGLVKKRLIFVHGSLLIDSDLKVLYQVLNSNTNKLQGKFVRSVMEKVANLKDEVNSKISSLDVKNNLINSFEKNFKSILIL